MEQPGGNERKPVDGTDIFPLHGHDFKDIDEVFVFEGDRLFRAQTIPAREQTGTNSPSATPNNTSRKVFGSVTPCDTQALQPASNGEPITEIVKSVFDTEGMNARMTRRLVVCVVSAGETRLKLWDTCLQQYFKRYGFRVRFFVTSANVQGECPRQQKVKEACKIFQPENVIYLQKNVCWNEYMKCLAARVMVEQLPHYIQLKTVKHPLLFPQKKITSKLGYHLPKGGLRSSKQLQPEHKNVASSSKNLSESKPGLGPRDKVTTEKRAGVSLSRNPSDSKVNFPTQNQDVADPRPSKNSAANAGKSGDSLSKGNKYSSQSRSKNNSTLNTNFASSSNGQFQQRKHAGPNPGKRAPKVSNIGNNPGNINKGRAKSDNASVMKRLNPGPSIERSMGVQKSNLKNGPNNASKKQIGARVGGGPERTKSFSGASQKNNENAEASRDNNSISNTTLGCQPEASVNSAEASSLKNPGIESSPQDSFLDYSDGEPMSPISSMSVSPMSVDVDLTAAELLDLSRQYGIPNGYFLDLLHESEQVDVWHGESVMFKQGDAVYRDLLMLDQNGYTVSVRKPMTCTEESVLAAENDSKLIIDRVFSIKQQKL